MTSDSPLVLVLDLQLDCLSLTIFDLCGLSAIHTDIVYLAVAGAVSLPESIVFALDTVLEQLISSAPSLLTRVRAIATTTLTDLAIFLTPSAPLILSTCSPHDRIEPHLRHQDFFAQRANDKLASGNSASIPHFITPNYMTLSARDTQHYHSSEVPLSTQSFSSHVCKIAKSPVWDFCGHILPVGTFLDSLLLGQLAHCNPIQASSTGLFDTRTSQWDPSLTHACSQGKGSRLIAMLPSVTELQDTRSVGPWLVKRFGFTGDCILVSSIPSLVSGYVSFLPLPNDGVIHFNTSDSIIVPIQNHITSPNNLPLLNPLHLLNKSSANPWLAVGRLPNAGQARSIVRDSYTKKWKAFNQLVQAVCPGGSVGLDNKLFTLFVPFGPHKGLRRFENGTRVAEFFDLRANPRCIIEGQALQIRKVTSQIKWQDGGSPAAKDYEYRGAAGSLSYDPLDESLIVPRWFAWGRAAGNERIAEVYAHVLGCPIMADGVKVRGCAEEDADLKDQVTRPTFGACFIAAYLLEKDGKTDFHSCIDSLMKRVSMEDSQRSLRRVRSTLACVQEDAGGLDGLADQDNNYSPSKDIASTLRTRRSLTVSVHTSQPLNLSPGQHRERSSSITPTSFLVVINPSSSPRPEYTTSSAASSFLVQSPFLAQSTKQGSSKASLNILEMRGVYQLAEPDQDLWQFYGAMLEEYIRLSDMIEETIHFNQ